MPYAITHDGKAYGPDGLIQDIKGAPLLAKDADEYNKAVAAREMEHIKSHPERLFLYVKETGRPNFPWVLTTWVGEELARSGNGQLWIGERKCAGFQGHYRGGSYRRPVSARIFGVLYHGWYYESSGSYCRLKKAKRQPEVGLEG